MATKKKSPVKSDKSAPDAPTNDAEITAISDSDTAAPEITDAVVLDETPAALAHDDSLDDADRTGSDDTEIDSDTGADPDAEPPVMDEAPDLTPEDDQDKAPIDPDPLPGGLDPSGDTAAYGGGAGNVQKRGGFLPMVIGGIIAAGLGFGAASYVADPSLSFLTGKPDATDELATKLDAQTAAMDDLRAAIPAAPDLGPLQQATQANATALKATQSALQKLNAQMTEMDDSLTTLTARLIDLEKRPISEGVSENAIKAYEDELDRLKIAMQAQRSDVESLIQEARKMEADAAAASLETQQRASLTRIVSAIEAGNGYATPLASLIETGLLVPQALQDNAAGVVSLSELKSSFPAVARDALARSRGDGNTSVTDFLRTQLGVRSLEPREGDSPDAVLSRAESALASGDLAKCLTELDTLPDSGTAAVAEWRALAQTRLDVLSAATGLMAKLNSN